MNNNIKQGLRENWLQFALLVIINSFVGGMLGLERSILPLLAKEEFHIETKTAILSFIIVYGIFKAFANYFAGTLANKLGRKKLLLIGWLMGIPVPFILMYGDSWNWILVANIFLGINQGLAWSSTIIMKLDLVGNKHRGLAMGLNESAGYMSVALMAFLTGYIAGEYGLQPFPFYLGIGLLFTGLIGSLLLIKETKYHVQNEPAATKGSVANNIFLETVWRHKNLSAVIQGGFVNNLNDGMMWGLLPLILSSRNFKLEEIGLIAAIYPAVWGIGQLFTGKMADHFNKKKMLFLGLLFQGVAILSLLFASSLTHYILLAFMIGLGKALVYPTFLATIAEFSHPQERPQNLGIFRFCRDLGYAFGAIITGILADLLGLLVPVSVIGLLTLFSAMVIIIRMNNRVTQDKKSVLEEKTA